MQLQGIGTPFMWIAFLVFILAMLALDLGVFHRREHSVGMREALIWTLVWIGLSLLFNYGILHWYGAERALEFFTGYLLEKALSVDNLFVFLVLFSYFAVPPILQHRILFWGILGALVMRAGFIVAGAALVQRFHWIMYVFGVFLVYTGFKLLRQREAEVDPAHNPALKFFRRILRAVPEYRGSAFFVREGGKLFATPLLIVLLVIEATDIVFAVDSIPAIFAITTDPLALVRSADVDIVVELPRIRGRTRVLRIYRPTREAP